MKMFHFDNRNYGESFTILAEDEGEARAKLLNYMVEQRDMEVKTHQDIFARQKDQVPVRMHIQELMEKWEGKMNIECQYDIHEYSQDEVMKTYTE